MTGKALSNRESLGEVLQGCNTTERLYLLALLKGYDEAESRDLAKGLGTNIDRYLLDPQVVSLREYFLDSGWRSKLEVEREWKDLLISHYIEMVLMAGIREVGKAEGRDNVLLKEATKCAVSQRDRGRVSAFTGSYDELILKKHRVLDEQG